MPWPRQVKYIAMYSSARIISCFACRALTNLPPPPFLKKAGEVFVFLFLAPCGRAYTNQIALIVKLSML